MSSSAWSKASCVIARSTAWVAVEMTSPGSTRSPPAMSWWTRSSTSTPGRCDIASPTAACRRIRARAPSCAYSASRINACWKWRTGAGEPTSTVSPDATAAASPASTSSGDSPETTSSRPSSQSLPTTAATSSSRRAWTGSRLSRWVRTSWTVSGMSSHARCGWVESRTSRASSWRKNGLPPVRAAARAARASSGCQPRRTASRSRDASSGSPDMRRRSVAGVRASRASIDPNAPAGAASSTR